VDIIVPRMLPTAQIAIETWLLATLIGLSIGVRRRL